MDSDSNDGSDSNDDASEEPTAVECLLTNQVNSNSTLRAHLTLRIVGFDEEQINDAFMQVRRPLQKEFKCKKANCATFSSKVNLKRHCEAHKGQHSIHARDEFTQQLTQHWQELSHEEKSAMILSVDSKHEEMFQDTVLETLALVRYSGETKYLPSEVMSHVDQLAVIEMACGSEIAEFLESTSEGTFLTNAHYQQPEHTGSELTLECHLIDVLAYYSFFLEMLLVESFNSKQAHAKELDELAALEEAKSNKMVNQKLKGESAMQGNETTEEMLPKIGGDTSHDVAAATSHGVGSAEQGTGVTHAKELDELAALEEAKSNKLVNQKLKGEIAEQGNKSTEETLPKIGGDTSHDVAAATAHGVGSAEQGTGVTPHKPGGVTSHDVSSSTSAGVGSAETAKAADNFLWVYHEFLDLLTGVSFTPNPPRVPFFLGQLEALVFCRDFKFRVFYSDIKRHKKKLALTIRDNRTKVDDLLKSALQKFVTDNKYHEKLPKIELFIEDCPAAFVPTTFLDYKKRKPLIEIYKLPHSRKEVIVLTRFGRKIARQQQQQQQQSL